MKFRHFEFKLFPKLKSKKKKKPKICNPDFPRDIGLDKNFNYSKPGYYGYYDNLGADDVTTDDTYKAYSEIFCRTAGEDQCDCYQTQPLPELKINVEEVCDCGCTYDTNDVISAQALCTSSVDMSTYASPDTPSTIPRTRTRIKTNPWLPSPKATPAPSPTETCSAIVFSNSELTIPYRYPLTLVGEDGSPNTEPRQQYLLDCVALGNECETFHNYMKITDKEDLPNESPTYACSSQYSEDKSSNDSERNLGQGKELSLAVSASDTLFDAACTLNKFAYAQFLTYDSSATSTPITESLPFNRRAIDIPEFEYESNANELLENSSIPRDDSFEFKIEDEMVKQNENNASIERALSLKAAIDESCQTPDGDYITADTWQCSKDSDDISTEEAVNSSNSDSNGDWTFCDDGRMQTSTDTGYASISRDTDSITSAEDMCDYSESKSEDGLEWDNEPSAHNLLYNFYQSKQLMACSLYTEKELLLGHKRSRSLADIEMSLDEKVSRLRAEKLFVQMKIREAIQEEIFRRRQLRIFRSISPDNRKEVLIKTLHDLKARLENQSARLQTSYDTVLSLQRRFSQRRSTPKIIETSI